MVQLESLTESISVTLPLGQLIILLANIPKGLLYRLVVVLIVHRIVAGRQILVHVKELFTTDGHHSHTG